MRTKPMVLTTNTQFVISIINEIKVARKNTPTSISRLGPF